MSRTASSWKTTITGIIQALGVLALTYGVMSEQQVAAWGGVSAAVLGALLNGLFARDDNVSSEGKKAGKAMLLALCILPAFVLAPGCSQGASRYRVAETLYVGAVTTATDALDTGAMSLDQARRFEAVRDDAREMLDAWGALEVQGAGGEFDGWDRLETLLDMMIEMQMEVRDGRDGTAWFDTGGDAGDRDSEQGGRGCSHRRAAHPGRVGPDPCRIGERRRGVAVAA